jgi:hypothetical protein
MGHGLNSVDKYLARALEPCALRDKHFDSPAKHTLAFSDATPTGLDLLQTYYKPTRKPYYGVRAD